MAEDFEEDESPKSDEIKAAILNALKRLFLMINSEVQAETPMDAALLTGLTPALAVDISSNFTSLKSIDILKVNYYHLKPHYLVAIEQAITQCMSLEFST